MVPPIPLHPLDVTVAGGAALAASAIMFAVTLRFPTESHRMNFGMAMAVTAMVGSALAVTCGLASRPCRRRERWFPFLCLQAAGYLFVAAAVFLDGMVFFGALEES